MTLPATTQNGFPRQSVTGNHCIAFPDATIEAVVPASVAYLNKSTDEHSISKAGECRLLRLLLQIAEGFGVFTEQ
jgi:hypothetical protein